MTAEEYNKYVSDKFKEEYDKGQSCIVFDKPVRLVEKGYETETKIKELHKIVVKYNSMINQLNRFLHKHGFETNEDITHVYETNDGRRHVYDRELEVCPELSDIQICCFLPSRSFKYDSSRYTCTRLTLIFRNITFADYYTRARIMDYVFDKECNVVFENIDFNNVLKCNMFFGMNTNSCHSVFLKNIKVFANTADII